MQTFLPYSNLMRLTRVLDDNRLGNQIKKCAQIATSILGGAFVRVSDTWVQYSTGGFPHHWATDMWREHLHWLALYACTCIREYRQRENRGMGVYEAMFTEILELTVRSEQPWWLGDERLHSSHRSQLLRKDPEHYGRFGWSEEPGGPRRRRHDLSSSVQPVRNVYPHASRV